MGELKFSFYNSSSSIWIKYVDSIIKTRYTNSDFWQLECSAPVWSRLPIIVNQLDDYCTVSLDRISIKCHFPDANVCCNHF